MTPQPEHFEIKEEITPFEAMIEEGRRRIGIFLGPLAAIILYFIPMPSLGPEAHTLAAILGWVVLWWITEPIPIPVTSLLGAILCVVFQVGDVKKVFAPFADPLIYLFFGSFLLANAMALHGLDRRFAYSILSLRGVGERPGRILLAFGAITAFISMWISNTATAAMMLPIAMGIVTAVTRLQSEATGKNLHPRQLPFGTGMMLMVAYAASAGGIGTPVGTPPNIIGIAMIEKYVHVKIPFFQWMAFAVPLLVTMYGALFLLLYFLHKPEIPRLKGGIEFITVEKSKLGKWSRGEKNSFFAFCITVSLWIAPGVLAVLFTTESTAYKTFNNIIPESVAALLGATLLFLLPVDWKKREFTINWKQAIRIDWGTLLLFGGGISMGNLMFDTKLAEEIGKGLLAFSGMTSMWGITFAAIVIAILISEATSNTASANMVVPVIIALSMAAGINPVPPAIGGTLGASWGFMLPVSTPPNAIVYGSGLVPITKMIRAGIVFDIVGALILWLGLRILLPAVGLG
jgi:solute carrier family 13 (sodium-dependent dicarboxylate transporter), member 2/3/5